jgi:predicted flap endonuclease-1-like 5' DNA nuclease
MARIIEIEGIGPRHAAKLKTIGVATTERLLKVAAHPQGRKDLAEMATIPEKLILEWVNLADLMRIKGIGPEYSDLLEEAGVDTVRELRGRRPDALHQAAREINVRKRLVRRLPSLREIERWVAEAKRLRPLLTY